MAEITRFHDDNGRPNLVFVEACILAQLLEDDPAVKRVIKDLADNPLLCRCPEDYDAFCEDIEIYCPARELIGQKLAELIQVVCRKAIYSYGGKTYVKERSMIDEYEKKYPKYEMTGFLKAFQRFPTQDDLILIVGAYNSSTDVRFGFTHIAINEQESILRFAGFPFFKPSDGQNEETEKVLEGSEIEREEQDEK